MAAQVAQVTAEIERQKVRALQVERQLDADVVQVAEADRRAREEEARGHAARFVERGQGGGGGAEERVRGLRRRRRGRARGHDCCSRSCRSWPRWRARARSSPWTRSRCCRRTPAAGDGFARAAIGASEQIKAATGVDLAAAAQKRVEGT